MSQKRKHYLVYKIQDTLNRKVYIGVHATNNIEDGYMGSGVALKKAISKIGIENFTKTILYDFDTKEEMLEKEEFLVNKEFLKRDDTYNIIIGGQKGVKYTLGLTAVKDKDGNTFLVSTDDPRYKSGELVHVHKGMVVMQNKDGDFLYVDKNDPRIDRGILQSPTKGKVIVKDDNRLFQIDVNDPRYKSGEFVSMNKDTIVVVDKNGKYFRVNIDDPRYKSGELKFMLDGKEFTKERIAKQKATFKKINHQGGKTNSQFGTCWITHKDLKENKKIKKHEINTWLNKGWVRGRILK